MQAALKLVYWFQSKSRWSSDHQAHEVVIDILMGEARSTCCDAFTLAKIAGHSSIAITERYCHPQADAIERAFAQMAEGQKEVVDGRHHKIPAPE